MKKPLLLQALTVALGLAWSAGALAQGLSRSDYSQAKDRISAEYKAAKAACGSLSGNAQDICVEEAKGQEKTAKAELEATYQPTPKSRYQARVAKAEAGYEVAKERCDDLAGNARDVCVKEAKAALVAAKADAKVQWETAKANLAAQEKSGEARRDANAKKADASKDAAIEKREAQYQIETEKCEAYAGDAKTVCLAAAKSRYGKP